MAQPSVPAPSLQPKADPPSKAIVWLTELAQDKAKPKALSTVVEALGRDFNKTLTIQGIRMVSESDYSPIWNDAFDPVLYGMDKQLEVYPEHPDGTGRCIIWCFRIYAAAAEIKVSKAEMALYLRKALLNYTLLEVNVSAGVPSSAEKTISLPSVPKSPEPAVPGEFKMKFSWDDDVAKSQTVSQKSDETVKKEEIQTPKVVSTPAKLAKPVKPLPTKKVVAPAPVKVALEVPKRAQSPASSALPSSGSESSSDSTDKGFKRIDDTYAEFKAVSAKDGLEFAEANLLGSDQDIESVSSHGWTKAEHVWWNACPLLDKLHGTLVYAEGKFGGNGTFWDIKNMSRTTLMLLHQRGDITNTAYNHLDHFIKSGVPAKQHLYKVKPGDMKQIMSGTLPKLLKLGGKNDLAEVLVAILNYRIGSLLAALPDCTTKTMLTAVAWQVWDMDLGRLYAACRYTRDIASFMSEDQRTIKAVKSLENLTRGFKTAMLYGFHAKGNSQMFVEKTHKLRLVYFGRFTEAVEKQFLAVYPPIESKKRKGGYVLPLFERIKNIVAGPVVDASNKFNTLCESEGGNFPPLPHAGPSTSKGKDSGPKIKPKVTPAGLKKEAADAKSTDKPPYTSSEKGKGKESDKPAEIIVKQDDSASGSKNNSGFFGKFAKIRPTLPKWRITLAPFLANMKGSMSYTRERQFVRLRSRYDISSTDHELAYAWEKLRAHFDLAPIWKNPMEFTDTEYVEAQYNALMAKAKRRHFLGPLYSFGRDLRNRVGIAAFNLARPERRDERWADILSTGIAWGLSVPLCVLSPPVGILWSFFFSFRAGAKLYSHFALPRGNFETLNLIKQHGLAVYDYRQDIIDKLNAGQTSIWKLFWNKGSDNVID